jgi:hypothetical protein
MRDLTRVINFLCEEVIPVEEVALISDLVVIRDQVMWQPPESQGEFWRSMTATLNQHLGFPNNPWKRRVSDVCLDKEKIPEDWKHV